MCTGARQCVCGMYTCTPYGRNGRASGRPRERERLRSSSSLAAWFSYGHPCVYVRTCSWTPWMCPCIDARTPRARWRRQSIFISYRVLSVCLTLGRRPLFFLFPRERCKIRRNKLLQKFQPLSGWRFAEESGRRSEANFGTRLNVGCLRQSSVWISDVDWTPWGYVGSSRIKWSKSV